MDPACKKDTSAYLLSFKTLILALHNMHSFLFEFLLCSCPDALFFKLTKVRGI